MKSMGEIVSYGGGVGSTALLLLKKEEIDEAVFVNHGGDYPHTYNYIKYVSRKVFPITVIKPNVEGFSDLYEFMFHKRIIPSIKFRWCSYKFKINPTLKYVRQKYKRVVVLIGYTYDEKHRISDFKVKDVTFEYPLVNEKITRQRAIEIIKEHGLTVPKKSACWFCPFAPKSEIFFLKHNYPELYKKLKELHSNCMRSDLTLNFLQFDEQKQLTMLGWGRGDLSEGSE